MLTLMGAFTWSVSSHIELNVGRTACWNHPQFSNKTQTLPLGKQLHILGIHIQVKGENWMQKPHPLIVKACASHTIVINTFLKKTKEKHSISLRECKVSIFISNYQCIIWLTQGGELLCQVSSTRADPFLIFLWPSKTVKFRRVSLADRTVLKPSPKSWLSDHKILSSFISGW